MLDAIAVGDAHDLGLPLARSGNALVADGPGENRVFLGEPTLRTHLAVATDEETLAGVAQAGALAHDLSDLVDRELERAHTHLLALVEHGRGEEAGCSTVAGFVGFEVDQRHDARSSRVGGGGEDARKVGVREGSTAEVGREVHLLEHRVHQVAIEIEQEDVVVAERLEEIADQRMDGFMDAVVRDIRVGPVELMLAANRVAVGCDVPILQNASGLGLG